MKEILISKIEDCTTALTAASTNYEKMELINAILQLKLSLGSDSYKEEIYVDIKDFINYYIKALDERKYQYDVLNHEKIFYYLEKVELLKRINLLNYLIRNLKLNGYEDSIPESEKLLKKSELLCSLTAFKRKNIFKVLYLITTYNVWTVLLSFFVLFAISALLLLPAPSWSTALVTVEYHQYSSNFRFNHLLNVMAGPFDISDQFKVLPLNWGGFLLCISGKILFLTIIFNVLAKHLEEKIKV
jgi:hypothetical protein